MASNLKALINSLCGEQIQELEDKARELLYLYKPIFYLRHT